MPDPLLASDARSQAVPRFFPHLGLGDFRRFLAIFEIFQVIFLVATPLQGVVTPL
jgi:hypothetical protein